MISGINLVVYPVKDLAQATQLYRSMMGFDPYAESPYYVGFRIGELEIGLDPNGHAKGMTGPLEYWQTDDIEKSLAAFVEAGATQHQEITDVGGGKEIAMVKDTDGNVIGLLQAP